jgi:hypothetical protein
MAEKKTFVATVRIQRFHASLSTRMRKKKRLNLRVSLFSTVAFVVSRDIVRVVDVPAVWAIPSY